jgi:hypothetical protein
VGSMLLSAGLLTAVLGMVLIVLAVIAGVLFTPGVVLLILGSLAMFGSAVVFLITGRTRDAG